MPTAHEGAFFSITHIPDPRLEIQWDHLYLEGDIKNNLLHYFDFINWMRNREVPSDALALRQLIFLEGPPGTGKTTLAQSSPSVWCKKRGVKGILVEVDVHALPSSDLGGSQKNVGALFRELHSLSASGQTIFVVIDEVESIVMNRAGLSSETDPVDTKRSVDAVLWGLDTFVPRHPNTVFVATSNIPRDTDRAFLERADLAVHVPLPNRELREAILRDGISTVEPILKRRLAYKTAGAIWPQLLDLTGGLSARQLRHLIIQAFLLADPFEDLELRHFFSAAEQSKLVLQRRTASGGVYLHDFEGAPEGPSDPRRGNGVPDSLPVVAYPLALEEYLRPITEGISRIESTLTNCSLVNGEPVSALETQNSHRKRMSLLSGIRSPWATRRKKKAEFVQ